MTLSLVLLVTLALPHLSGLPIMFLEQHIERMDPHGYWLGQFISMSFSLALTLGLMKRLSPSTLSAWGFNLRHWRASLVVTAVFIPVWIPMAFGFRELQAPPPGSVISVRDQVGVLTYLLTLCSIGQEALFRALAIHWLRFTWKGHAGHGWLRISHAALISVVIFVLAHVRPAPPYFDGWQLAICLPLGLLYAILFERTNSLAGPTLIHSISNTSVVALLIYT